MQFLPLLLILAFLVTFVQIGLLTIAFEKLGLSQESAFLLLFSSLFGSSINLPLFSVTATRPPEDSFPPEIRELMRRTAEHFKGRTMIAVNAGGCLIPLTFSLYLIQNNPLTLPQVAFATVLVTLVCHVVARPVPGVGIGMPIFVAPLTAAAVAILVAPEQSAPLAYVCGTLGVLIGADVLRLRDIRQMGTPIASIGGAGTFDGIFLTGIVAVLLA